MPKQVLLNPIGSCGDVFPFLPIGNELQRRGYHVALMTNPMYRELAGHAHVEFLSVGSKQSFQEIGKNPWHRQSRHAWKLALRELAVNTMRETFDLITHRAQQDETIVVASPISFGAKLAWEKTGNALINLYLSPYTLRSCHESPVMHPLWLGSKIPRFAKRIQFWAADRFFIDPVISQPINEFRNELELSPSSRYLQNWIYEADAGLTLFPREFATPQPDWPDNLHSVGPIDWNPPVHSELRQSVHDFIESSRPILLVGGSIGLDVDGFYSKAIEFARRSDRKLILLTNNPRTVPSPLPSNVFHSRFFPIEELLPLCCGIIHSGSIGTTLRSLNSGTPQLIFPQVNDQFDNAHRVCRLGAGRQITSRGLSSEHLEKLFNDVVSCPTIKANCLSMASQYRTTESVNRACDRIIQVSENRNLVPQASLG